MSAERYFANGRELKLGKRLGTGGEGSVYLAEEIPGYAAKIFAATNRQSRAEKVAAMVEAGLWKQSQFVAFPEVLVRTSEGKFAGFLMRVVAGHKELHELQVPGSRLRTFPTASFKFLVRVAKNIASVFAQLHQAGCVVGDVNQRGILVSEKATVIFIDADSIQFNWKGLVHKCMVGVPEYTPPELQGRKLDLERSVNHDTFGLAVCLFELLCMCRHPFAGRPKGATDDDLETSIRLFDFAYSTTRAVSVTPPPASVRGTDFPPTLWLLFEKAFSPQGLGGRPSAEQWVAALDQFELSLRNCADNRSHWYAREATACPWCRMEREGGRPLFLANELPPIQLQPGKISEERGYLIDLKGLLASIGAVALPQVVTVGVPPRTAREPSEKARAIIEARKRIPWERCGGVLLGGLGVFVWSQVPVLWWLYLVPLFYGWRLIAKEEPSTQELESQFWAIDKRICERIKYLQANSPLQKVGDLRKEITTLASVYEELCIGYRDVEKTYQVSHHKRQLERYLARFSIRGARVEKLKTTDVASLASFGVTTALDVVQKNVRDVFGIGPVKEAALQTWVDSLKRGFVFTPVLDNEDVVEIRKLRAKIVEKQQGLEDNLRNFAAKYKTEVAAFQRWQGITDSTLLTLANELAQVEADLRFVGSPVPALSRVEPWKMPSPPLSPVQRVLASRAAVTQPLPGFTSPLCPLCNARMVRKVATKGHSKGKPFWGCIKYPSCTGLRKI